MTAQAVPELQVTSWSSNAFQSLAACGHNGWIDEKRIMMEVLLSIKRAGADMILMYFAKDVARLLRGW